MKILGQLENGGYIVEIPEKEVALFEKLKETSGGWARDWYLQNDEYDFAPALIAIEVFLQHIDLADRIDMARRHREFLKQNG